MYSPSYGDSSYGGGGGQKQARALYDFVGEQPSDLSFRTGDVITITSENSPSGPEWWEGTLNGMSGSLPHNHVEVIGGGGGGMAFNKAKRMTRRFVAEVMNTSSDPAPPPGRTAASSTSFEGEGGVKGKVMFGLYVGMLLFITVSLIIPWYSNSENGNIGLVWQWTGRTEWNVGDYSKFFPFPKSGARHRSYKSLGYSTISGTMLTSMITLVIALFFGLFVTGWSWQLIKGKLESSKKLFIVGILITLLLLTSFLQFFRFNSTYASDIQPGCRNGVCGSFSGDAGQQYWGPTFGWVCAIVAAFFSIVNNILMGLVMREA